MFSVDEFVKKYERYTDGELFEILSHQDNYSQEAQQAFRIVVDKRGGLESLRERQKESNAIAEEMQRVRLQAGKLSTPGVDVSFVRKMITSTVLSDEQLDEVVESAHHQSLLEHEDIAIKPKTIAGSIIGGGIASVVGGIFWGLQLIYSKKIFTILVVGLCLLCYGIIRLCTNQSKKNQVVLIASVISVILALFIGQLLYKMIGFQE